MNYLYERAYGDYYMVHFPYYRKDGESLWEGQRNLTEACLEVLPPVEGKTMLEVGCGNGMQSIYIKEKHKPSFMMGLDLNMDNVELASHLSREKKLEGIGRPASRWICRRLLLPLSLRDSSTAATGLKSAPGRGSGSPLLRCGFSRGYRYPVINTIFANTASMCCFQAKNPPELVPRMEAK